MIKKLLFILTVVSTATLTAQTFELQDDQNVNIGGTNHTYNDNPAGLSATKQHVENLTGGSATYKCEVQIVNNPLGTDLQVCYGQDCYVANGSVMTVQGNIGSSTVAGGATDVTLKVAPFSSFWNPGDEATWRVKIYNVGNANDSASAIVTWKVWGVSVEEISNDNVSISAYPNPAKDNLNINYSIDGTTNNARIDVYDVLGQLVRTHSLINNSGQLSLNVQDLNAGVYFYSIKVDDATIKTERVIIK